MDQVSNPRGRGALLKALRDMNISKPGEQTQKSEEPPKPRGRAAMLNQLKALREQVGPQTSSTSDLSTKEEVEPTICSFKGSSGKPIYVTANYIGLEVDPNKGIYEYELIFTPAVDSKFFRVKILNEQVIKRGWIKMFDGGSVLYLPIKLPDVQTIIEGNHPSDQSTVTLTIIYKKKRRMSQCVHFYNILFKRVMIALEYGRVGQNYYNMNSPFMIPQHRLEVLPGYALAVDEYEGGLMVCVDSQHRVLRTDTALKLIYELRMTGREKYKDLIQSALLGAVVLTKYNNKTYIIDDIIWDATPSSTFETKTGKVMSYLEYYQVHHGITIVDRQQPLLLHVQKIRTNTAEGVAERQIMLVPELCTLTGLTEEMRGNYRIMKDVAMYTRITPQQRMEAMRKYQKNVAESEQAQKILADWGLKLKSANIDLNARILNNEVIVFGNNQQRPCDSKADFTRDAMRNPVVSPVHLRSWAVVFIDKDNRLANEYVQSTVALSNTLGMQISHPYMCCLNNDKTSSYVSKCQEISKNGYQMIVFIFPNLRTDLYSSVKKVCCLQQPVPIQCIISKTLRNPKSLRTIIYKVAVQILCKIGGSPWALQIPCQNWMVIGIDVYHSGSGSSKQAVLGFVSSSNNTFTSWYSLARIQRGEISAQLKHCFAKSLENYKNSWGRFPDKIIVFRDGVGDGQMNYCSQFEVPQFEDVIKQFELSMTMTFVVVKKRINTRIFAESNGGYSNPLPGTIVDTTITRKYLFDYFLVPQNVNQGTVTPTHYVVLNNSAQIKPDILQRLSFKLCHLYYNWSGTIRVPAPCQYAHKLAYLIGNYVGKEPSEVLNSQLYYL
ncbi:piwi-like protein Ago3 [Onthophagus taurus]|uniref:piwi-like protein Ago3 n=1 Tax=Onthophagus taurus TaxID=166361 RepID=UPI0039BE0374